MSVAKSYFCHVSFNDFFGSSAAVIALINLCIGVRDPFFAASISLDSFGRNGLYRFGNGRCPGVQCVRKRWHWARLLVICPLAPIWARLGIAATYWPSFNLGTLEAERSTRWLSYSDFIVSWSVVGFSAAGWVI